MSKTEASPRLSRVPRPSAQVLQVLRGRTSAPQEVTRYDNDGSSTPTIASLVIEGAGMAGLEDPRDSIEWSGIFHHSIVSARLATHIGKLLRAKNYEVDPELVLRALIASHTGRRKWDEANWYPADAKNAETTINTTNELIGLKILNHAKINPAIMQIVSGLAHGLEVETFTYNSLEYRVASYADHRTGADIQPLALRMSIFLVTNFFPPQNIDENLKNKVKEELETIIERGKTQQITVTEAIQIIQALGANKTSSRLSLRRFMELILEDAELEGILLKNNINPSQFDNSHPPVPRWEKYLRRLYLQDAIPALTELLKQTKEDNERIEEGDLEKLFKEQNFNMNKWAAPALINLLKQLRVDEKPTNKSNSSSKRKDRGWQRAIDFFQHLDDKYRS